MNQDWFSISYLQKGSSAQQEAYQILLELKIMEVLKPFKAVLTGTFPLDIPVPGSDLDICCQSTSLPDLALACRKAFGLQKGFIITEKEIGGVPSLLVRFFFKGMLLEIFGQHVPVQEQYAFRHMVAEHYLLKKYGEPLRQEVLALKKAGLKTEPAFAKALKLEGNPYESLLRFCP